jgi:RNA polymerase sigma-70 factor (sigma-E family)
VTRAEEDFRGWVASQRASMRATAYMLSGDWYLADDLVQDALARLFSVWGRVTASGDPNGYARRVLVNLYLDHRRRPSRREEPHGTLPDGPAPEPVRASPDPVLVRALREVPAGQRAVLVLRYWDDLSVEQTAAALKTSAGNVKSQSSRGLVALRAALARQGVIDAMSAHEEFS